MGMGVEGGDVLPLGRREQRSSELTECRELDSGAWSVVWNATEKHHDQGLTFDLTPLAMVTLGTYPRAQLQGLRP